VYRFTGFTSTVAASFAKTDAEGVAWDGTDVYFGEEAQKVMKGTGFSATVQSSFNLPLADSVYGIDLTANTAGDLISVQNSDKAYRLTGFSSTISASFTIASAVFRGIAWDGSNAIVYNIVTDKVTLQSGFTSSVTSSFTLAGGNSRDVTWDGTNVYTALAGTPAKFRQHSGFSVTVSTSFSAPAGYNNPLGIKWDGFPASGGGGTTRDARKLTLLGVG
jgi:hypothetical protein